MTSETTVISPPITVDTAKEVKPIIVGRFTGMLSGFQSVVFRDLKYAGFDQKTSHKIAMDYGSQLGLAMRNDENIKTAVGKASKDGLSKLSAKFHDKVLMHNAMAVYRVVQTIADLYSKESLLNSYEIDMEKLSSRLTEYVSECSLWATDQKWAE